ncbi:MAG: sigma-70 family RNA polymerase sigma factor, partial [Candidatus Eisenbacteria bacterium]
MPRVPVSSSRARKAPRLALVARRATTAATKATPKAGPKSTPGPGRKIRPAARVTKAPTKAPVTATAKPALKRVPALHPGDARRTPAAKAAPAKRPPLALAIVPRPAEAVKPFEPVARVPRERLLERYTPLIKYVVERLSVGLPKNVDHDDLMSAGILGLLDAYDKFDDQKGTKFETYAVWRIKGAVLDQLRALDWASRSVRRKAREVEASTRRLDQR